MNGKAASTTRSMGKSAMGKVLNVLRCFSYVEPELSAPELCKRLDMPSSTLYRHLQILEDEGLLRKIEGTNRYSIGLYTIELAGIALNHFDVRRLGQSNLDALAQSLGMNCNIAMLSEGDIFHLAYSITTPVEPYYTVIGRRTPANLTAMGKVLLAEKPFEEVCALISHYGWRAHTEYSICTKDRLKSELAKVRQQGYAVDLQENNYTTCCLAAPIRLRTNEAIAAISASTSPERFHQEWKAMRAQVMNHADRISFKLGYAGTNYLDRMSENMLSEPTELEYEEKGGQEI